MSQLVRSIPVGSQQSLFALSLFDSQIHVQWDFDTSQTQQTLLEDIKRLVFQHRVDRIDTRDIADLVSSYSHHHGGDRVDFPDTVVVIADSYSSRPQSSGDGDRKRATHTGGGSHIVGRNIIVINVGEGAINHGSLTDQATDFHHIIDVKSFADLPGQEAAVRDLICY